MGKGYGRVGWSGEERGVRTTGGEGQAVTDRLLSCIKHAYCCG